MSHVEIIERQPEEVQLFLRQLNQAIKAAIPDTMRGAAGEYPGTAGR